MTSISEITDGIALECLKQIASEGRIAYRDELMGAIGTRNMCGSTATGVINRLIKNGKVEHVLGYPLQRGLWLRIVETGQETAAPRCLIFHHTVTAKHSRDSTPTLPRHTITRSIPTLMGYIDRMMREENMTLEAVQITLMARGMQQRETERFDGAT